MPLVTSVKIIKVSGDGNVITPTQNAIDTIAPQDFLGAAVTAQHNFYIILIFFRENVP